MLVECAREEHDIMIGGGCGTFSCSRHFYLLLIQHIKGAVLCIDFFHVKKIKMCTYNAHLHKKEMRLILHSIVKGAQPHNCSRKYKNHSLVTLKH